MQSDCWLATGVSPARHSPAKRSRDSHNVPLALSSPKTSWLPYFAAFQVSYKAAGFTASTDSVVVHGCWIFALIYLGLA